MSEIAITSGGSAPLTSQVTPAGQGALNVQAGQSASFSSVQVSQSSEYSSVSMSSQSISLSSSSSVALSENNSRMMELIMALIEMLFGNDDEDSNGKDCYPVFNWKITWNYDLLLPQDSELVI